jgi:hypothetical protein
VPTEAALEGAEERLGHPAEVGLFHIAILDVVGNAVGKNVVDANFADAEAVAFEELPAFATRVGVGNWTAGLRFRVFGDEVRELPELAAALGEQNPGDFVGAAMIDHDFDGRAGASVLAKLIEDGIGVRRVVDDAEGVDEVVRLDRNKARELFGVAGIEADVVLKAEQGGASAGELHGFFGQIDGRDVSAAAGEVDGVGADATADFENFFAAPAIELGESGYVRLDKIFAGFDFIEILPGADGRGGMADVAGTLVPIFFHPGNLCVREVHDSSSENARDSFAAMTQITAEESSIAIPRAAVIRIYHQAGGTGQTSRMLSKEE